uniref:Rab-GAP TBC domain-containing protein n=1 Tax=Panagrellus redivivus TaxID=6233 RepID=A0A7E4VT29_PANRE
MLDVSRGGMVAAILVGPCAVDYTLLNTTMDMEYRDPTADELVQRSRIASTTSAPAQSPKRPPLSVMKRGNSMIRSSETNPVANSFNRDYVFSLHQNQRSLLLYGKNNVGVANNNANTILKGYLSLHREHHGALTVKWTPNQLMHSSSEPAAAPQTDNNHLWKYVVNIAMEPIIYIHLHQQGNDHPVSLVFVDTDGVQYAPFHFPPGQHCLSFLTCLETGLSPFSRLDPPLWNAEGKGKILPKLRRKTSSINSSSLQNSPLPEGIPSSCNGHGEHSSASSANGDLPDITDYVFRIVKTSVATMNGAPQTAPILSNSSSKCISEQLDEMELDDVEVSETKDIDGSTIKKHACFSVPASPYVIDKSENSVDRLVRNSLGNACETMRIQLLSRAFYGWLSYTRHLKTIRTHLSCLVTTDQVNLKNIEGPVNRVFWEKCRKERTKAMFTEFTKRVYCYGIDPDIRIVVWPYLTRMVAWTDDIESLLPMWEEKYTKDLQKWGAIEEEVIKRDQEAFRVARLRQSSANGDLNFPPIREQSINNDVFEEELITTNGDDVSGEIADIIEEFGSNLHRIEKDVDRCDRTKEYFSDTDNLKKLKRIMCTYVWRHINDGYIQGMCDIAAPLLVMYNDEVITLQCFERLMERMRINFPHGNGIEENLGNLRSIVQVMDPELYELIMSNADFTHLYFAYRWFLLDFKRELTYETVYQVWEVIIAAEHLVSPKFQLFFAFALLTQYRHILIENSMEFTDVIKFFNEMAEKHNVDELLVIARDKLSCLQALIREMNDSN